MADPFTFNDWSIFERGEHDVSGVSEVYYCSDCDNFEFQIKIIEPGCQEETIFIENKTEAEAEKERADFIDWLYGREGE